MSCRVCAELETYLNSARLPDPPSVLVGLTEAGTRNRQHQRQEREQKAEAVLLKHRKICPEAGGIPPHALNPAAATTTKPLS
jgi:hypothetical protein